MSTDSDTDGPDQRASEEPRPGTPVLEARLVCYDRQPDELTIFPADVEGSARMTTWISAKEGSFVGLDAVR